MMELHIIIAQMKKCCLMMFTGAIEDYENSLVIDSLNINTLFELAEAKIKVNDIEGTYRQL